MKQSTFNQFAWGILALSVVLPFIAWGSNLSWNFDALQPLTLFGLFGLLAWMTMWTHYVYGAVRITNPNLKKPKYYGRLTAWFVLGAILLHPGILAVELWQNGAGFPPSSFTDYVGASLQLAVIFGSIALTLFLSFEVFDRIKTKAWVQKYWKAISISQSLAMILIFVHGLRLGSVIDSGWFYWVWIAYGAALIPCFYIIHKADFTEKQS